MMIGESRGFFLSCGVTCGVYLELRRGTQEASCVAPGKPSLHSVARGSVALFSSHSRGIGPQDALKGESRGLSQIAAGKPGVPRLVTVTSGSFSGCILEVRNTVELAGASQDSTGFGAMEKGLISS